MASLQGFDASQVPEQEDMGALPAARYPVIAVASEFKPTKAGTGEYLQVTFEVLDGQYKGRKLWARLNLKNPNPTAVDIAQRELAQLCKAVGIIRPNDSAELHNKPLFVNVKVELDDRRRETNTIDKFEPANPGAQAQPMYSPPAQQAQQQAQQPAGTPADGGVAPWLRPQ